MAKESVSTDDTLHPSANGNTPTEHVPTEDRVPSTRKSILARMRESQPYEEDLDETDAKTGSVPQLP
jgi:hypothetical protein